MLSVLTAVKPLHTIIFAMSRMMITPEDLLPDIQFASSDIGHTVHPSSTQTFDFTGKYADVDQDRD